MYSTVLSIFYLITYVAAVFALFAVKKSENKLNFVLCIPVNVLVMMLYTAFFAGIIDIFGIPINLVSLGTGNLLAAAGLGFYTIKSRKFQKYKFSAFDLIVLIGFAALTIVLALSQFGSNLFVNFETTDPSRHMRYAQIIIERQSLIEMYFASLNHAVFLSVGLGFVKTFWAYKLFIISEVLLLFLAGCIMYCVARQYAKTNLSKFLSTIFIAFYLLCYPLNNLVFGFVHLGIGVMLCAFLIMMVKCYEDGTVHKIYAIIVLMLGAYGIIICYSLFAPFIYIAVALLIAIKFIKEKRLLSKEFFATEFGIFLIPCAMGIYYSFFKMFDEGVSGATSLIAMEGYIYRDLYSNFIIILPFVIYGLITAVAKKKIRCQHIFLLILGAATLLMFVCGLQGKVSSYYFYKMYYPLSMVCFVVAIEGICDLCKKSFTIISSYILVWAFLAVMNFTQIDDKLTAKKVLMSPNPGKSGAYFSIIEFNQACMQEGNFSVERMQLYEESHNKQNQGSMVTLLSTTEPIYWFEAMVQCSLKEFYCYDFNYCDISAYMQNVTSTCDYVLVYTEHNPIFDEYIEDWQIAYQNSEGILYSIK